MAAMLLQSGQLAPFVDLCSLARRDLINGRDLMLRAALTGTARERLERGLAQIDIARQSA